MTTRFNMTMSEQLSEDLETLVNSTDNRTKGEVIRKALELYRAAVEGKAKGLSLALVNPKTDEIKVQIVGL